MSDVDKIKTLEGLIGYTVANIEGFRELFDRHHDALMAQKKYNDKLHEEINVLSEGLEAVIISQGDLIRKVQELEYRMAQMEFKRGDDDEY